MRRILGTAILLLAPISCAHVDRVGVQARSGAPVSARVTEISIPLDPDAPRFIIAVEPVTLQGSVRNQVSTTRTTGGVHGSSFDVNGDVTISQETSSSQTSVAPNANQIATQFVSALSAIENFSVVTPDALVKNSSGQYVLRGRIAEPGEKGPYLIRAMITEYEAASESAQSDTNVLIYNSDESLTRGMVAIDVQVIEGRTNRVTTAFPVQATFAAQSSKSGTGLVQIYSEREQAKSVLDQALRKAVNDAATRVWQTLRNK
jgi:hypothetical protein